jgi:hypothetical protein
MEGQERKLLLGKMSADLFPETIALFVIALIKKKITRAKEWAVGNAPRTIEEKGSDSPLIDSGQMRNSIDWQEV